MKKFGGALEDLLEEEEKDQAEKISDEAITQDILLISGSPTKTRLEHLWQLSWVRGGFGFCPPLSAKDQANLFHLGKRLPWGMVCMYIVAAVEHWDEYRRYVARETGFADTKATRPAVWYLHTNIAPGVAWVRLQQSAPEKGSQSVSKGTGGMDWSVLDD